MLTRSIGSILRGKATPLQLIMASVLGALLGFIPGYARGEVFLHAPGLVLSLLILLIILNANLALAVLTGALAKLVSLLLMPVSFQVGQFLLDGPTTGLFRSAINAPVLALFGFEYYATTGGLALGLIFGLLVGIGVVLLVNSFRRAMSKVEEGSERYQKYASKRWVKALSWILFGGGRGKKTYAELLDRRIGNPIRFIGVLFAILLCGLVAVVWMFTKDGIVMAALQSGLERANGATVDLKTADLDLKAGKLTITGLAMADPSALDTDLFRASNLEADVSGRDLLRKRMTLDHVRAADASSGEKRAIPGRLIGSRAQPTPPPPGEKTIDDYIKEAKVWKERLAQARRWLDEMNKKRAAEPKPGEPSEPGAHRETLKERLAREAREKGYSRVAASHLVEGAPTLLVKVLNVEGLKSKPLPGRTEPEVLDVQGENISTQPWLVQGSPRLSVKSRSKSLDLDALLAGLSSAGGDSSLKIDLRGLAADVIGQALKVEGAQPLKGGTMDVAATGSLSAAGILNLPLNVTLRDTTMTLPQAGSAPIKEMVLPIGVRGPLDNPGIIFDQKAFADALAKAGATELAAKARGEAEKAVNKAAAEAEKKVQDKITDQAGAKLKEGLGGILNQKPKQPPPSNPK
jgi:uncharacterized protein (TIGR03546 family)